MSRSLSTCLCLTILVCALSGCVVVHEERETVAINRDKLAGSAITPGQPINVGLSDGTVFAATFVSLSKTELVTQKRGTFVMETLHTPLAKITAISYERVVGTHVEHVGIPFPNNIPLDMGGLVR